MLLLVITFKLKKETIVNSFLAGATQYLVLVAALYVIGAVLYAGKLYLRRLLSSDENFL